VKYKNLSIFKLQNSAFHNLFIKERHASSNPLGLAREHWFGRGVMKKAVLFEKENGRVRCLACKQRCLIAEGYTGICGVRQNVGGKLFLLVYGKASAVNVDPVEKKPLYHFLPGTPIFSIGTVGCNFACSFCQNWDLSQATKELRLKLLREKSPELIGVEVTRFGYDLPPERIVSICLEQGIPSIAYTYNEPVIFFEYLYDTARLAKEKGLRNVMVSNGYESEEALELLKDCVDAMNIDLKSFSDEFYKELCKARLQPVLDTIKKVHELGIWLEVTTLVIPGRNDSEEELRSIASFIASIDKNIPWHVTAFHPAYKLRDAERTSHESLVKAYSIGRGEGLRFVYVGNVVDEERSTTYCPRCEEPVVKRGGYEVSLHLEGGACKKCKERIPGVWS